MSIFDIRKKYTTTHQNIIHNYWGDDYENFEKVKNGQNIFNHLERLENQQFGIIPYLYQTFTNSGTGPKGTKIITMPFIKAIESGETQYYPTSIIRNGKTEDGYDYEYLYIRRHGNDKVKVGSRKENVFILPCKTEQELDKLIEFYKTYPTEFHCKLTDYNSSKITLVPDWYKAD